jgi:hypothetical protein
VKELFIPELGYLLDSTKLSTIYLIYYIFAVFRIWAEKYRKSL